MRHLLGLVVCAAAAWAAPSTILPRYTKWICNSSECPSYWFQGTDSCYHYCVDGGCNVRGQDCQSGCATYCTDHCDAIADEQLQKNKGIPICKTGPLPAVPIQQPDSNPDVIHLPNDYQVNPPGAVQPPYAPVTNPAVPPQGALPDSEQQLGAGFGSVALEPLPDGSNPTGGTVDLSATLPPLDNTPQPLQVSDAAAEALGITGFTGNNVNTDISFDATNENQLAFLNSDPLGGDIYTTTENSDPGLVNLGTSLADYSIPDGGNFVASNNAGGNYEDFLT